MVTKLHVSNAEHINNERNMQVGCTEVINKKQTKDYV